MPPSEAARSVARTFVAEIGDQPWRSTRAPIAELSNQPNHEVRTASLPVDGENSVHGWYLHAHVTDDVDLIAVAHTELLQT